jgi:hexosaminidase
MFQTIIAEGQSSPALIPQPVSFTSKPGTFALRPDAGLVVQGFEATDRARLREALRTATGLALRLTDDPESRGLIHLELSRDLESRLGNEGYRMSVTSERVKIAAAGEAGLFYGGVTLRQLLPADAFRKTSAPAAPWEVPCAEIEDYPRFGWRGLLVDPARHFLPVEFLKKMVDTMALHKFNTLQIHLTDDQGWRLEIKKYPRLMEVGAVRKESPLRGDRNQGDGKPHGPFFYTQEEMRELVVFARARNVTILPEIEMPGHFLAALAAYPQFSCTGGPFEVRTRWGVHPDILCAGNDDAVRFACDVLEEVVTVFPGEFIHIGGDEAPRDRWKACPKCQARIKTEGLANEAQLQTWFNHRIEEFLSSKGRRMIGWDEILEGGLTPKATVMSWRGMDGGIKAAAAGHDVVMAPTTHCYFDYAQAKNPGEPESIGGFIPLETAYAFEPVPSSLPEERQRHILGGQGALWGEFFWSGADVEYFAFPRAAALSEVLWSPAKSRNLESFQQRLPEHLRRLENLGVNFRREPVITPTLKP